MLNSSNADLLKKYGFNSVRHGWMYTGFNPAPGVFNETYFRIHQTIADVLAARGIYTMLDAHQDILSSKFCLYDGFPLWTIDKSVARNSFPYPFNGTCASRGWMTNALSEAASQAFGDIFTNHAGMRDDFGTFWTESAKRWANASHVLGYELINEPFPGDIFADPTLLIPGVAGAKSLQPFYEEIVKSVHANDDKHMVFYEPVTWGMLGDFVGKGNIFGSGFTEVPGGDAYKSRSVFSYHYYCSSFQNTYGTNPLCDDVLAPLMFDSVMTEMKNNGGSSFLTEFGGWCDPTNADQTKECNIVMDLADKNFQSWFYWAWGFDELHLQALSRTYGRAYAGKPLNMTLNKQTSHFSTCFSIDTSIIAPTEIFAQFDYSYGGNPVVTSTDNIETVMDKVNNIIHARPKSINVHGQVGCITVDKE